MLGKLSRFANPEIEHLLRRLQADEESYDADLRSRDREKLVLPVQLSTTDNEFKIRAFSRDVSPCGLGLISPQPFSPEAEMDVELQLHDAKHSYRSVCRWCCKFGQSYWASGWQLPEGDQIDVRGIKDVDARVEFNIRATEREKFAIPVIVHQKGKLPRIQGFTRNMSGDGANLVSNERVKLNSFCMLEFIRNDGERCDIVAECVWSEQYGESHWMTGWQFPRLERIAKFHAASFDCR